MPRRDQTGPNSQGSMTGRGLGNCNTSNTNSNNFGRGRGRGNGRFNNFPTNQVSNPSLEDEKELLTQRLEQINSQLKK